MSNGTIVNYTESDLPPVPRAPISLRSDAMTAGHAVALAGAVLDKQIMTARQFPREVSYFKAKAVNLLKGDVETARAAEYEKPVAGGKVRGPSARLMEVLAICWTNLQIKVDEPTISEKSVSVKATAWDLEANLIQECIVTTPIVKADGSRYAQHMIDNICGATQSKARRNAIMAVIPRCYVNEMLEEARKVARANEPPLNVRRAKVVDHFAMNYKVNADQICKYVGVSGVDDLTDDHLDTLRLVVAAIKDGEAKPEDLFGVQESKMSQVTAKLAERKAKKHTSDEALPEPAKDQLFSQNATDEKARHDATK